MHEIDGVKVEERVVLSKYEGEPLPENEFERIELVDGVIESVYRIENGEIVSTVYAREVN